MAAIGDNQLLVKVAVYGITFSIICTLGLAIMWNGGGDYSYDDIAAGRADLIDFSGESMVNQTPWKLTHAYTAWVSGDGVEGHVDADGWLYGTDVDPGDYDQIGKTANIKLNPERKSSVPISVSDETIGYTVADGYKWWAQGWWSVVTQPIGEFFGNDPRTYSDYEAGIFTHSGWRYTFDPMLPFSDGASSKDGTLSLVWYTYNGQEGLSGALQIYDGPTLLSSYSATDIVADYDTSNALASVYRFNFEGVPLTLSIRFDPDVIESGTNLMSAFVNGDWSMAISSASAGNFYDLEDSNSFSATAGGMVQTFIDIYTWDMPNVENTWAKAVIWLMVGLPMTLAMLLITMTMVSSVTRVFGIGGL